MEIADALTTGLFRNYLRDCRFGSDMHVLMRNVTPMRHETEDDYLARFHRVASVLTTGEECLEVDACIRCSRGQEILATRASKSYGTDPTHALTVLELYSRSGENRYFPNTCEVGRQINSMMSSELENRGELAETIASSFGCTDIDACSSCGIGQGLIDELLVNLAEFGMDGEAGYYLRNIHMWIV